MEDSDLVRYDGVIDKTWVINIVTMMDTVIFIAVLTFYSTSVV